MNAMSATGIYVPLVFIFGRKRMKAELLDSEPPGAIGMVSDSSYMNSDLFMDWLEHFKDHTIPTQESPVLLILDNLISHCAINAINYYRKLTQVPRRKIWRCVGCQEIYKEPITEDWIECSGCKE